MAIRPKLPSINEILGRAKKAVTNLISPITDDKGFIQRGQFTFQPIKQFLSVTPRGGFAAGIQRVKSAPLTSYFLPTAIQYGQTGLPRPIEQFAAHTQSALSFGLLRPKLPEPRTTPEKIAAYGGEIVGSIPAFTLGEAAVAPLATRLSSLPRIGRLAEVGTKFLGGGAAGFALTTPGGIKERAKAAKEQFSPIL